MYRKVKHRLVTLYTVTTGVILLTALISLYLTNVTEMRKEYKQRYYSLISTIADSLKQSNVISSTKLIRYEKEYQAFIYIEEKGIDVGYQGSSNSTNIKKALVEEMCTRLTEDGFNLEIPGYYAKDYQSDCYTLRTSNEIFWGCATKIDRDNTNLSLIVFVSLDYLTKRYVETAILYAVIMITVMCIVYIMSRILMQKALAPLKENKKKQDDFIACASHELRSPLAYIKTANSTLSTNCLPYMDTNHKGELESFIENTSQECDRMSLLIEDMLVLAAASNNTWTIKKEERDLDQFFVDTYERCLPYCASKKHYFEMSLPDESFGMAIIDEKRLFQVIQTLVNNALQYTPEKSMITLAVKLENKNLMIYVIDHGSGITDEEKEKVFERYYRQDLSHADRNHFGLGLSISKELVNLLGGTISIVDTPGGGSTFRITLPLEQK